MIWIIQKWRFWIIHSTNVTRQRKKVRHEDIGEKRHEGHKKSLTPWARILSGSDNWIRKQNFIEELKEPVETRWRAKAHCQRKAVCNKRWRTSWRKLRSRGQEQEESWPSTIRKWRYNNTVAMGSPLHNSVLQWWRLLNEWRSPWLKMWQWRIELWTIGRRNEMNADLEIVRIFVVWQSLNRNERVSRLTCNTKKCRRKSQWKSR